MRKLFLFFLLAAPVCAQTINPNSQITWPRVSGTGTPSGVISCPSTINNPTNATVGTPYTDIAGPHYWVCTTGGWFQVDGAGGNITDFKHNGTLLTGDFATNPQIYDYDESTPSADTGFINAVARFNTGSGKWNVEVPNPNQILAPVIAPPINGQYVILFPHRFTITRDDGGEPIVGQANGSSASGTLIQNDNCSLSFTSIGTWDQYSLADYPGISAGNVTAVYAAAVTSLSGTSTSRLCFLSYVDPVPASASLTIAAVSALPSGYTGGLYGAQQGGGLTTLTGATISSATAAAQLVISGETQMRTTFGIQSPVLIVYYTGSPVTNPNYLYFKAPIIYDSSINTVYMDPNFPQAIKPFALSQVPPANISWGNVIAIQQTTDCVTDSGNAFDVTFCRPKLTTPPNIYAWVPMTGGSAGSTYFTEIVTCTTTCTLSHTPTEFDNLSVNGLTLISGTDFTRSGTTVTLAIAAIGGDVYYAQYHY